MLNFFIFLEETSSVVGVVAFSFVGVTSSMVLLLSNFVEKSNSCCIRGIRFLCCSDCLGCSCDARLLSCRGNTNCGFVESIFCCKGILCWSCCGRSL